MKTAEKIRRAQHIREQHIEKVRESLAFVRQAEDEIRQLGGQVEAFKP